MKLNRLNELNMNASSENTPEVVNIFSEILGQIKGNENLTQRCGELILRIKKFINKSTIQTEQNKRSLMAELREKLRCLHVQNYNKLHK